MGNILHGARARLGIFDGQNHAYLGIFSDVSYGLTYDVQAAWILGRYTAAETEYVAQELVQVTANGYKVLDHGWYADAKFPLLVNLANAGYLTMDIQDRQSGKVIAKISKLRAASASTSLTPRMLSSATHTYIGILYEDETAPNNAEDPTAMEMPS